MNKVIGGIAGVVALILVTFGAGNAGATEQGGDSPCLPAVGPKAYTVCMALWNQPGYDKTNPDGSKITVPEGSELVAELKEMNQTPTENPDKFYKSATSLIHDYFKYEGR